QIAVIRETSTVVLQAPTVHVVAVVNVDLIVARIRGLRQNSTRQFVLESEGILISPRNLEVRRVETGAASDTSRQAQTRAGCANQSIREWIDERIWPRQTSRRRHATVQGCGERS